MREEYDFSNSKPNPYCKLLKKEVKIKIDEDALLYFKNLALELGIPYQNLINRGSCKSPYHPSIHQGERILNLLSNCIFVRAEVSKHEWKYFCKKLNSYLRDCVQHHRKPAVKWA